MEEYFKIGKLVASFATHGEMIMTHSLEKNSSLKGLEVVFIEERKNSFLPWFIESLKVKSEKELIIKLETIDTKEATMALLQKEIWLTESDFKSFADKSSPISLLGYDIIEDNKSLGKILEVLEQPHQILCRLEIDEKEVLIPLNESTLLKIDHKKKNIQVSLPEGLLDIYLG
jgi:16S rRNA processing protein RimM